MKSEKTQFRLLGIDDTARMLLDKTAVIAVSCFNMIRKEISSVPQLTDFQKGFLTGLIDGEGSINVVYRKYHPHYQLFLEISMTNLEILQFVKSMIGGNIRISSKSDKIKNHAQVYRWTMGPMIDIKTLLNQLPLIVKRKQKELAIQLLNKRLQTLPKGTSQLPSWTFEELQLAEQIRYLNRKGPR